MSDTKRLKEIVSEMKELLDEYKGIVKYKMDKSEYERFRYNTLGHIEPLINSDHSWVTSRYSSQESLEEVADSFSEDESPFKIGMIVKIKKTNELGKIVDMEKDTGDGDFFYVTDVSETTNDTMQYSPDELEIVAEKALTPTI